MTQIAKAREAPTTQYRLPDGKYTRSSRRYIKAWRDLAKPITKHLGYQVIGFDPGVLFSRGNGQQSLSLPVDVLELVARLDKESQR